MHIYRHVNIHKEGEREREREREGPGCYITGCRCLLSGRRLQFSIFCCIISHNLLLYSQLLYHSVTSYYKTLYIAVSCTVPCPTPPLSKSLKPSSQPAASRTRRGQPAGPVGQDPRAMPSIPCSGARAADTYM